MKNQNNRKQLEKQGLFVCVSWLTDASIKATKNKQAGGRKYPSPRQLCIWSREPVIQCCEWGWRPLQPHCTAPGSLVIASAHSVAPGRSAVCARSHRKARKLGPGPTSHPPVLPLGSLVLSLYVYTLPPSSRLTEQWPVHRTFRCSCW